MYYLFRFCNCGFVIPWETVMLELVIFSPDSGSNAAHRHGTGLRAEVGQFL